MCHVDAPNALFVQQKLIHRERENFSSIFTLCHDIIDMYTTENPKQKKKVKTSSFKVGSPLIFSLLTGTVKAFTNLFIAKNDSDPEVKRIADQGTFSRLLCPKSLLKPVRSALQLIRWGGHTSAAIAASLLKWFSNGEALIPSTVVFGGKDQLQVPTLTKLLPAKYNVVYKAFFKVLHQYLTMNCPGDDKQRNLQAVALAMTRSSDQIAIVRTFPLSIVYNSNHVRNVLGSYHLYCKQLHCII